MHKKLSFHLLLKKVGWVTMLYIYKCRVKTIFSLKWCRESRIYFSVHFRKQYLSPTDPEFNQYFSPFGASHFVSQLYALGKVTSHHCSAGHYTTLKPQIFRLSFLSLIKITADLKALKLKTVPSGGALYWKTSSIQVQKSSRPREQKTAHTQTHETSHFTFQRDRELFCLMEN